MILAAVLLAAAALLGDAGGPGQSPPCRLPAGWSAVAAERPRFVIFGELHGTREAPAMVGDLACALALSGKPMVVAVELWSSGDAALQAAWAGSHASFAEALARTVPDWEKARGGAASSALFAMLVRLHALKAAGRRIAVVAFSGPRNPAQAARWAHLPGQGPREAAMAENIQAAAGAARYDQVLVLVGNLHAAKQPVTRGNITFEPMAVALSRNGKVISLDESYGAGSAWFCAQKCEETPVQGRPGNDPMPGIDLGSKGAAGEAPRYDGVFRVGPVTPAPPVDLSACG